MKIFLLIFGVFIYGFIWDWISIEQSTDEYLEKSMDRAYKLAESLENKQKED